MEQGANVNIKDVKGKTPLRLAVRNNEDNIVEMLLQNGVNVNERSTKDLSTPLHRAAFWGNVTAVRSLLEHGASPDVKNCSNRTPLEVATRRGDVEIVKVLEFEILKKRHLERLQLPAQSL